MDLALDPLLGFRSRLPRYSFLLVAAATFTSPLVAQNYLTSTGSPSFGVPVPVEMGSVDTASGNLHLTVPLGSYPQRGTDQPEGL